MESLRLLPIGDLFVDLVASESIVVVSLLTASTDNLAVWLMAMLLSSRSSSETGLIAFTQRGQEVVALDHVLHTT